MVTALKLGADAPAVEGCVTPDSTSSLQVLSFLEQDLLPLLLV